MRTDRLERLQANGWNVGSVADFLQLSEEESRLVDLRLSAQTPTPGTQANAAITIAADRPACTD